MTTVRRYSVPEISCDHCKQAIQAEVTQVEGVTLVDVDIEAKSVSVTGGGDEAIVAAIDEAGFDVA